MPNNLEHGRVSYRRHAWEEAYRALASADQASPLAVDDLECLATAAYLTGRDADFHRVLERIYPLRLDDGAPERAARSAFWQGLTLLFQGETGQANGWFVRARRAIEGLDCVEQGYLLLPVAEGQLAQGNGAAAHASAAEATEFGARFGDADLVACARHLQGRALIQQQQLDPGLALLDDVMLSVIGGDLSPMVTGLIYCSVIDTCQQVYALSRAHEWTLALTGWCERQPEMVAFTGSCLVHRAEVLQLQGAWPNAMTEACRACERGSTDGGDPPPAAFYRKAEIHRLRGEFAEAEAAYRCASRLGMEPQPGLALLRLSQGRSDAAEAAIRRVTGAAVKPLERAKLLPAYTEILLAVGNVTDARGACRELEDIAVAFGAGVLNAAAAHARGAVELADGDARSALTSLRRAFEEWRRIEAPYESARTRVLLAQACLALGDEEGAGLEWDAARAVFERLGAAPDLFRLAAAEPGGQPSRRHGLTPRELDVLRLIAAGKTNKAVAAELCLSERTIDRHLSNIFTKLDVPSRSAATAYAYRHKLI